MPTLKLLNSKLLSARLEGEQIFSRRGAMVAYQGEIEFARSFLGNGGVQEVAMRAATGEGLPLMSAKGRGEVLYADHGRHVTLVALQGDTLYVESDNVLAFDPNLRGGTVFLGNQGGVTGLLRGAATGQGLFTSTFTGKGQVALLSDGDCLTLEATDAQPVFVDPQAYIGHTGSLTANFVTDVNWKSFLGQTSGESYQLKFSGRGSVYIQASER
jgi:uncharacterized protein (AIM24 family)